MCVLSLLEMMEGVGWSREGLAQDCIEVQSHGSIHEDNRFKGDHVPRVRGEGAGDGGQVPGSAGGGGGGEAGQPRP